MHEHSRTWRRPAGFDRFAWDYDGAFGSTARWGRWQRGIAVGAAERDILRRLTRRSATGWPPSGRRRSASA